MSATSNFDLSERDRFCVEYAVAERVLFVYGDPVDNDVHFSRCKFADLKLRSLGKRELFEIADSMFRDHRQNKALNPEAYALGKLDDVVEHLAQYYFVRDYRESKGQRIDYAVDAHYIYKAELFLEYIERPDLIELAKQKSKQITL